MGPNSKSLFHTSQLGLNNNTMKYETKKSHLQKSSQHLLLSKFVIAIAAVLIVSPINCESILKSKSILCVDAKCECKLILFCKLI